jgi:hypothetical protein
MTRATKLDEPDFRRAAEPKGYRCRTDPGVSVSLDVLVLPHPASISPGAADVDDEGSNQRKTDLAAVGVTAQIEAYAVSMSILDELGRVHQ